MAAPQLLAFAGSTRASSFNKKLVKLGARAAAEAGADVLDLRDLAIKDAEMQIKVENLGRKLAETVIKLKSERGGFEKFN